MKCLEVRDHETHERKRNSGRGGGQCDWRENRKLGRSEAHRRDLPQKSIPKTRSKTEHAMARMHRARCHALQCSPSSICDSSYREGGWRGGAQHAVPSRRQTTTPTAKHPLPLQATKSVHGRVGTVNCLLLPPLPPPLLLCTLSPSGSHVHAYPHAKRTAIRARAARGAPAVSFRLHRVNKDAPTSFLFSAGECVCVSMSVLLCGSRHSCLTSIVPPLDSAAAAAAVMVRAFGDSYMSTPKKGKGTGRHACTRTHTSAPLLSVACMLHPLGARVTRPSCRHDRRERESEVPCKKCTDAHRHMNASLSLAVAAD